METTIIASREIMWNVSSLLNSILMYALLVIAIFIGSLGVVSRVELWSMGRPSPENSGAWLKRTFDLFGHGFLQRETNRERTPGIFHTLIYIGFLVLLFTTTMVMIDHDLGIRIYRGDFYLGVTVASDIFGFGLLLGALLAAHRRYIQRADLIHSQPADNLALVALILLVVQGFALEGLRIHGTDDPWSRYSPIGYVVAGFFWPLSDHATVWLHYAIWWFHTITVMMLIAIVPYTKFFHIIASSANLFFRRTERPKGQLQSTGDIEKLVEKGDDFSLGLGTIKDYSWKNLLDLDACTSCGRCQDACPAYLSGKPLSPKWMILDTRNHALSLHSQGKILESRLHSTMKSLDGLLLDSLILRQSGLKKKSDGSGYDSSGKFRSSNSLVQQASRTAGGSSDDRIAGDVMDPEVFWSCTTCMACVQACPVGINHVDQIIGNRRNMALMHGEIPAEAQQTLKALENRANPYGPADQRTKWAEGLDLPILKAGDSVDYLYWVGCVSSFDNRKQKIAKALVTLMREAGLSFGILGNSEGCSGDPARRLGEENLFQTLAKRNIHVLTTVRFKTLVANCPHCFNSIKNEYPEFGRLGEGQSPEIIHHSQLLKRLLAEGKLNLKSDGSSYTFHDPCYLGRYNDEYDAPRETLRGVSSLKIIEMEKSREKGMCCGAGGGHFWMDLKKGERVNSLRVDQAAATGATKIATACPFCMQMMEDGIKLTNREGEMSVKDIAEVLVENLVTK